MKPILKNNNNNNKKFKKYLVLITFFALPSSVVMVSRNDLLDL